MKKKIAFDIELMKPACVLVAAGYGADSSIPHMFPTDSWLLAPTDNMGVFEVTDEQLKILVDRVEQSLEFDNR